jgi:hypothetical protein
MIVHRVERSTPPVTRLTRMATATASSRSWPMATPNLSAPNSRPATRTRPSSSRRPASAFKKAWTSTARTATPDLKTSSSWPASNGPRSAHRPQGQALPDTEHPAAVRGPGRRRYPHQQAGDSGFVRPKMPTKTWPKSARGLSAPSSATTTHRASTPHGREPSRLRDRQLPRLAQVRLGHARLTATSLEAIPNPFAVVWDPLSTERTGRDARFCFVDEMMPAQGVRSQVRQRAAVWPRSADAGRQRLVHDRYGSRL